MVRFPLSLLPHVGRLVRATRWRRTTGRPRVWAHRGASAHEPENTMPAFEAARRAGADGIELDVRLDRDGNVVVFHDDELDRLAGRPGKMLELSAAERARLRVGGHAVPTLAEVLAWLGDLEINVELKSRGGGGRALAASAARVVKDSGRADQVLVSSFDPFALLAFHAVLADPALAYLFHEDQLLPLRKGWVGRWAGVSLVHPEHTLCTEATVDAWHAAGLPVNTWTVDDPAELRRLAALGIDGVFANDPAAALAVLG
jgi:glycerophosphoryl diester phosphodiesterase|nr:glycerophosphodiester phosphodiesterase [Kofleriaceae bacterium]